VNKYKWLPSEPTDAMLNAARKEFKLGTKPIGADLYSALIAAWQAAPDVEAVQTIEELEQEIYENTQTFISHNVMQWMLKRYRNNAPEPKQGPVGEIKWEYTDYGYGSYASLWYDLPVKTLLYTHSQADQTALINQLTDELNKTEAERVKWMTMALTSQPKRATKDHEIAKLVTELTAIANEYQGTQQLRNRLHGVVLSFVERYKREPLNEIELKQIFEQSIGLKYWDFAKAIEEAHGIGGLTYKPITHK
jgi:hypothetical protein